MEARQLRSYCLRIVIWFIVMLVGGCAFFWYVPPLFNDGSVTGRLRGAHIINIRPSNSAEEIAILDTCTALRYRFAAPSDTPSTAVILSRPVCDAVIALQDQWCAAPPQFRAPTKTEVVYDIGLLCSTFSKRRITVPSTLVPTPITAVFAEVPPLP